MSLLNPTNPKKLNKLIKMGARLIMQGFMDSFFRTNISGALNIRSISAS